MVAGEANDTEHFSVGTLKQNWCFNPVLAPKVIAWMSVIHEEFGISMKGDSDALLHRVEYEVVPLRILLSVDSSADDQFVIAYRQKDGRCA